MAAVGEVHTHHRVPHLTEGGVDGVVGLGAGVGLNIGVVRAKELAGPLPGNILHHVHALTAAVVTVGGIALSVFVGQHCAHGSQHRDADKVLRGDQLNVAPLALKFLPNACADLRVSLGNQLHHFLDHACALPKYVV